MYGSGGLPYYSIIAATSIINKNEIHVPFRIVGLLINLRVWFSYWKQGVQAWVGLK